MDEPADIVILRVPEKTQNILNKKETQQIQKLWLNEIF